MSRPRHVDPKLVVKAQAVLTHARDLNELRAAQAIVLPAVDRLRSLTAWPWIVSLTLNAH